MNHHYHQLLETLETPARNSTRMGLDSLKFVYMQSKIIQTWSNLGITIINHPCGKGEHTNYLWWWLGGCFVIVMPTLDPFPKIPLHNDPKSCRQLPPEARPIALGCPEDIPAGPRDLRRFCSSTGVLQQITRRRGECQQKKGNECRKPQATKNGSDEAMMNSY